MKPELLLSSRMKDLTDEKRTSNREVSTTGLDPLSSHPGFSTSFPKLKQQLTILSSMKMAILPG